MGFDRLGDRKKRYLKRLASQGKGVVVNPSKILQSEAPVSKIRRMSKRDFSLKRTALSFVSDSDFINKKDVSKVALKVLRGYEKRFDKGTAKKGELLDDPRQLIQRVQNEVVLQITESVKQNYAGEFYEWLPSDADEPDPEHQLNYGKIFKVGEGEMPGDRPGCRCGMRILVNETKLNLGG